jgi:hypothetical protein
MTTSSTRFAGLWVSGFFCLVKGTKLQKHQMLLSESRRELEQLERVWAINEDDIDFLEVIGQGSFGVVSLLACGIVFCFFETLLLIFSRLYTRSNAAGGTDWTSPLNACVWRRRSI